MNKVLQKTINITFLSYIGVKFFLWHENSHLQICKYNYNLNEQYKQLKGLRIVHISDLHDKNFGYKQSILVNKIKKLHPDIIITTGDMSNCIQIKNCINLFQKLTKITQNVYYITGNHEERMEKNLVNRLIKNIKNTGTKCLINDTDIISFNNQNIEIVGLRSLDLSFLKIIEKNDHVFRILLTHEPQEVYQYSNHFNLAFCGHTHGAQWRIPILNKGLFAPDQGLFPKYDAGEYNWSNSKMIINRGLGNEPIYPRLNNRPEIGVINFI